MEYHDERRAMRYAKMHESLNDNGDFKVLRMVFMFLVIVTFTCLGCFLWYA